MNLRKRMRNLRRVWRGSLLAPGSGERQRTETSLGILWPQAQAAWSTDESPVAGPESERGEKRQG